VNVDQKNSDVQTCSQDEKIDLSATENSYPKVSSPGKGNLNEEPSPPKQLSLPLVVN
jgi:hypothetical protein